MKTKLAKALCGLILLLANRSAFALDPFECVRDLLPVSEQATYQIHRKGVEKPILLSPQYLAFPEVRGHQVTGFFIYSAGNAAYYDSARDFNGSHSAIADLKPSFSHEIYELVAQPQGLETVTILYLPGFSEDPVTATGGTILGSTVLPVVGGFVQRTNQPLKMVYQNPADVSDARLLRWAADHSPSRGPASVSAAGSPTKIPHVLMNLSTRSAKSPDDLWAPLHQEMALRREWVQNHNLDEAAFKRLSRVMQTTCREK